MLPFSDTLLLLLHEHFDDLTPWAASLSQQCTFLLKEHTWVSTSNKSSSLLLSSFPSNWLYSWCASNNILKRSLNWNISSSTAIMVLIKSILSDHSAIDLPSPLSEGLFLLRQTLLSDVSRSCCSTSSLALCSTHCEHELSSGTLDVSLILVQVSRCWSSLTIIDYIL